VTIDLSEVIGRLNMPVIDPSAGPVPSPSPIKYLPVTSWQIVIGPNNAGPQYELTMARQRQLAFHVDESATLQFTIDGSDPALQYITELVTDCWVYRNGVLLFRGRIGSTQDILDGEADTYDVSVTCFDYREWLKRQVLHLSHVWSFRNTAQSAIITDLINYAVVTPSGIKPTIHFDMSKMPTTKVDYDVTVGSGTNEAIGNMSGFGWQVFPDAPTTLMLRAISPWYYNINPNFVLEYGSTVAKITRTLDTATFANSVLYTGDMKLTPTMVDAPGIASAPQGRLSVCLSNPSIVKATQLHNVAANAAVTLQNVTPTWSCDLAPGSWQSNVDAWIGDICRFVVKKGRLNVNDQYRITDLTITVDDDSSHADQVSVIVAKPPYIPS
jgi:hypothetical protein